MQFGGLGGGMASSTRETDANIITLKAHNMSILREILEEAMAGLHFLSRPNKLTVKKIKKKLAKT